MGKPVDLKKYCRYLHENLDWIDTYINLDFIDPLDRDSSARMSFQNLKKMRAEGLNPMAVFHVGEDISWLHRMLDLGCDNIGVAYLSMRKGDKAEAFYELVWPHLVDNKGFPVVKVHGLGEGRRQPLLRYPFASADSTSWLYTAQRTGEIRMPGMGLSMRNDGQGSRNGPHNSWIDELKGENQVRWQALLDKHAIDPRGLFEAEGSIPKTIRSFLTAEYYLELQEDVRKKHPIRYSLGNFMSRHGARDNPIGSDTPVFDQFRLHLVIGTNDTAFPVIARLKHEYVLISYYAMAGIDPTRNKGDGKPGDALRAFMRDPVAAVQKFSKWERYWDALERYVK